MKVYRTKVSYFSGKLEAYLRYKEIPHTLVDASGEQTLAELLREIDYHCGIRKLPAVNLENGQWLYDTTPTMQWLETQYPQHSITPDDQALRFLSLLIEDYGDEWLWRPAMWWRWVPKVSRRALGTVIMDEAQNKPGRWWYFARRQSKEWLWGDGVTKENSDKVRDMLFDEFAFLEPLLAEQPFILGNQPSAADFGYFGSMFRHFGNDPDPAAVMREHAPNTYEWLACLWNLKSSQCSTEQEWVFPEHECWSGLLDRLVNDYVPYLVQNAQAFSRKDERFDYHGKNHSFANTKTTDYRVYCLENIQTEYRALKPDAKKRIDDLFAEYGDFSMRLTSVEVESHMQFIFKMPKDSLQGKYLTGRRKKTRFGQPRN